MLADSADMTAPDPTPRDPFADPAQVRAVVFDIGNVLEINPDAEFPHRWCEANGITVHDFWVASEALDDAAVGALSEADMHRHWQQAFDLDERRLADLVDAFWRHYVGELDQPMVDWFAGLRERGLRTGILSNSSPGAREHERIWGFEELADVFIYSHEVGLAKPDPRIYRLASSELGVEPTRIAFVDDRLDNVEAAIAEGWSAVHHTGDTPATLAALERLLAR